MSQDMAEPENIKQAKPRTGKKPPKKITEKYLYNSGLAYLQRFPASTAHFRRVMRRKIDKSCNYHKDQTMEDSLRHLESTIETFTRQGLLNDSAYLQGMVTSLRRRGLSSQAIHAKLQPKGYSQDSITTALTGHDADNGAENPELAAAVLLARRKRLGAFRKGAAEEKTRGRELSALARAGFGFDIAQKALALSAEDADNILNKTAL